MGRVLSKMHSRKRHGAESSRHCEVMINEMLRAEEVIRYSWSLC